MLQWPTCWGSFTEEENKHGEWWGYLLVLLQPICPGGAAEPQQVAPEPSSWLVCCCLHSKCREVKCQIQIRCSLSWKFIYWKYNPLERLHQFMITRTHECLFLHMKCSQPWQWHKHSDYFSLYFVQLWVSISPLSSLTVRYFSPRCLF